jgi:hypothetical protein
MHRLVFGVHRRKVEDVLAEGGQLPGPRRSMARDGMAALLAPPPVQPIWFPARLGHYWRAMCMRSSASVSSISLPLTSTVTLWMVPVNLNGLG